jgi:hypothetical protein
MQSFNASTVTSDNCIVAIGYSNYTIDSYETGSSYLVKTTADGNLVWEQRILQPDTLLRQGYGIYETVDNGFLILEFKHYPYIPDTTILVKTNSLGEVQWQRTYGYMLSELIPANDGYFLAGFTSEHEFDPELRDLALLRIDTTGNIIMESRFGTENTDGFATFSPAPDGGFI